MSSKQLGDYILKVEKVCKTFPNGVVALKDFSTNIRRSEVMVLIGPSGSGKSTFLRCLNGLEEIDSGSIVVDDTPLDANKKNRLEIRKEVGMVFQHFNLFPHLTVLKNITLAQMHVRKRSKSEAEDNAMELLKKVDISEKADSYPQPTQWGGSNKEWPLPGHWP